MIASSKCSKTVHFLKLNMQFQYVLVALLVSATQVLAVPAADIQETTGTGSLYIHHPTPSPAANIIQNWPPSPRA